jgi:hypothetical protein
MKTLPVGVELYLCGQTDGHMDRRTDTTKLTVASRNFVNAPRNEVTALMLHLYYSMFHNQCVIDL